jgi:hypothetical protein
VKGTGRGAGSWVNNWGTINPVAVLMTASVFGLRSGVERRGKIGRTAGLDGKTYAVHHYVLAVHEPTPRGLTLENQSWCPFSAGT